MTVVTVTAEGVPVAMKKFPSRVSSDGRYLLDGLLAPIPLIGDAGWSGISQLTTTEMDTYLMDRAGRGFNFVMAFLIDHLFCDNAPNNINNDAPFTSTNFTTPNEDYFTQADAFISKAQNLGITVMLFPLFLGAAGTEQGWDTEIAAASADDMTSWGGFCGNRYASYDNIIWCMGGDQDYTAYLAKLNAFVTGLQTYDTRHLITTHDARGTLGTTHIGESTWLTLNNIYTTYLNTSNLTDDAYAVSPAKPFIQIEGWYENENSMVAQNLRAQAYWTFLEGGCGHIFGNCPLWGFSYGSMATEWCDVGTDADWADNLNSLGALGMKRLSQLLASKNWHLMAPDSTNTVLTVGYGTRGAADFAPCGFVSGGSLAMIYMPSNRTMTVDMSEFSGTVTCRWYDPLDGSYTADAASPHANTGTHDFSRAGTNSGGAADWVLILEA